MLKPVSFAFGPGLLGKQTPGLNDPCETPKTNTTSQKNHWVSGAKQESFDLIGVNDGTALLEAELFWEDELRDGRMTPSEEWKVAKTENGHEIGVFIKVTMTIWPSSDLLNGTCSSLFHRLQVCEVRTRTLH